MTGHQIGSGDPADEALAQRLSWNLLGAVRGVGFGRGLDLALRTLFIRWVTLTDPEHGDDWHRLTEPASEDERMEDWVSSAHLLAAPSPAFLDLRARNLQAACRR